MVKVLSPDKPEDAILIGQRFKIARQRARITALDLAWAFGWGSTFRVWELEHGKRPITGPMIDLVGRVTGQPSGFFTGEKKLANLTAEDRGHLIRHDSKYGAAKYTYGAGHQAKYMARFTSSGPPGSKG